MIFKGRSAPPRILIVEHGTEYKRYTLERGIELGLDITVAASTVPAWLKEVVAEQHIIHCDTYHPIKLLNAVSSYLRCNQLAIDAVGTFWESTVIQTAFLASALKCRGVPIAAATRSSQNKLAMRMACATSSIPQPKFAVASMNSEADLQSAIREVGYPCVLKPLFGSSSYGARKISASDSLQAALADISHTLTPETEEVFKNFDGLLLVEEYRPGKVISVDGVIGNSEVHFAGSVEFQMGSEPYFLQEGSLLPAPLTSSLTEQLRSKTRLVIETLGFNDCGFHCEWRVDGADIWLLEIAARLPGGPLPLAYQEALGIDLLEAMYNIWLGKPVSLRPSRLRTSIQRTVYPRLNKSSMLVTKGGSDSSVRQSEGIWDYIPIAKVGDVLEVHPKVPSPLFYLACSAETEEEAASLLENAINRITYECA